MTKSVFKKYIFILPAIFLISGIIGFYSVEKITFENTAFAKGKQKIDSIDLKLKNQGGKWQDSVTKTWENKGAMPGDWPSCRWIRLKNVGNVKANFLDISLENKNEELGNEESDTSPGNADGMDKYAEITRLRYGRPGFLSENLKKKLDDFNGNGFIDLDDFENQGFDNLTPPCLKKPACRVKQLSICLRLHSTTPNAYQGDRVISDLTFTLTE